MVSKEMNFLPFRATQPFDKEEIEAADRHPQILTLLSLNLKAIISQKLVSQKDENKRIPVCEILTDTPYIKDLIREGNVHEIKNAMEEGVGMQTYEKHLIELYKQGKITGETAVVSADRPNEVRIALGKIDKGV